MEVRKGYKNTEVGLIPGDWQVQKMSDVTTLMTNGFVGTATSHYTEFDDGIIYIQGFNVEENAFNFSGIKRVTRTFHKQHAKSKLQAGDLLTIQTGEVGLTTIVPEELAGANCHALIISRFRRGKANPKYCSYYLNSHRGRARLREIETGTTMKHINVGDMIHFTVPLPPTIAEQESIATALSDADALITSLEKLIAKKRLIKQGAMQELLTPKEGWVTKKLREVVDHIPSGIYGFEKQGDGLFSFPVATTAHIDDDDTWNTKPMTARYFQKVSIAKYAPRVGDLIVVKSSGSAEKIKSGKLGLVDDELSGTFIFSNFLMLLRPTAIDPVFLYNFLISHRVRSILPSLCEASTYPNLRMDEYLDIAIPYPRRTEQTRIAGILSDMDTEISSLETKLAKYKNIKQGMMQELLTGKIRLVKGAN